MKAMEWMPKAILEPLRPQLVSGQPWADPMRSIVNEISSIPHRSVAWAAPTKRSPPMSRLDLGFCRPRNDVIRKPNIFALMECNRARSGRDAAADSACIARQSVKTPLAAGPRYSHRNKTIKDHTPSHRIGSVQV